MLFDRAKSYYDPKQKAAFLDSALDAVLCIKAEASGLSPYSLEVTSALLESVSSVSAAVRQKTLGSEVSMTAEKQFYALVLGALLSVERVLATRLSNVGSFDPAGTIAEIQAVSTEIKAREAKDAAQNLAEANSLTQQAVAASNTSIPAATVAPLGASAEEQVSAKQASSLVEAANNARTQAAPLVANSAAVSALLRWSLKRTSTCIDSNRSSSNA